jgi:uncharacterized protein (DUF1501 family)
MGFTDDVLLASVLGLPALVVGAWLGRALRASGAGAPPVAAAGTVAGLVCGLLAALGLVVMVDNSSDANAAVALTAVPAALLANVLAGLASALLASALRRSASTGADTCSMD